MGDRLNLGIVGINWRGADIKPAFAATGKIHVKALCSPRPEPLAEASQKLGVAETFTDYERMLDAAGLDAVFLATPMDLHVAQSIAALQRGVHVLCEVSAATDVDGCRKLVHACRQSRAVFILAEQYNYRREPVMVRRMVRRGEFGHVYYAEGEFNQNIQSILGKTPWRRRWQVGVNGITYGAHSLGPILQWMEGDRVVAVSCVGAGRHYRDEAGNLFELEAAPTMMCRMGSGGLVRVRCDLLSHRPMGVPYQLQGTDGYYDRGAVWLRSRNADSEQSESIGTLEDDFLPAAWREADAKCRKSGCAGDDYLMALDFVEGIRRGQPVTLGIDEAMDLTLPGLISQESIRKNGAWLDVPDSREW